jgi:hypothetical protein
MESELPPVLFHHRLFVAPQSARFRAVSRVWFVVVVSERKHKKERDTKKDARAKRKQAQFWNVVYTKFTDAW